MATFQPGDVFAGHRIVRLLGLGGHSEVWLVTTPAGSRAVLKIVRGDLGDTAELQDRLAHEGEALAMIDHVNVVRFLGAGIGGPGVWLLLEYVEGQSLREVLRLHHGPLPLDRVVRWIRQACEGIGALHTKGAVHRDIKPENLLVAPTDLVKVIDFGIVKLPGWGPETAEYQKLGTVLYMAPEQLAAPTKAKKDPRSDIYAMGLVLFELLVGKHPLMLDGPQNTFEICLRHFTFEPPPLRSLRPEAPGDLELLVAQVMAKKPDLRPASMEKFAERLQVVLELLLAPLRAVARSAIPRPDPNLAATADAKPEATDPLPSGWAQAHANPGPAAMPPGAAPPNARSPGRVDDDSAVRPAPAHGPQGTVTMLAYGGAASAPGRGLRGTIVLPAHGSVEPPKLPAQAAADAAGRDCVVPPAPPPAATSRDRESGIRENARAQDPSTPVLRVQSESGVRESPGGAAPSAGNAAAAGSAFASGAPAAPPLTIQQYASLCVDLEASPHRTAEVLHRYRLTPERKFACDAYYARLFAERLSVWAEFDRAQQKYRTWLRSTKQG